ncbi:DUF2293 domain-containing protein [Pelagicoccus albus]|uniref:DUF2293 domain-containing protein n=1 Tax=Pelagicoccus albus TaxID=415222 RepID=A0A7X1B3H1_9BACT|nr:DUF2293 domain-containing protein [Pelagicoccus albus]MBC2604958.1 DUF2293 domain-containing protein [Pelagicoccus albus]
MPLQSREVKPHPKPRQVVTLSGEVLIVPAHWDLLEPGDATLTRRVKAKGPSWTVKEKRGRRVVSLGVWADKETIEIERLKLKIERQKPEYQKQLQAGRDRRAKQQENYVEDFRRKVFEFLDFHPKYEAMARVMAQQIASHATPVGSGTVARTERIPIEKRAEAATIAWMRHQTTAYDDMHIPRVKGARREARRRLAAKSKELLETYRRGTSIELTKCPLANALTPNKVAEKQSGEPERPSQGELFS